MSTACGPWSAVQSVVTAAPAPPPPAPAAFTVAMVSFDSNVACGGYGAATISITNTGQFAAQATVTGTTYIPALGSAAEGYWNQQTLTVNPGATAYVNMSTEGPMQVCGYSATATFSIAGANAIQYLTGNFTIGAASGTSGGTSGGGSTGGGTSSTCAAVQQQYNSLSSQIMNIRIQLSTMSTADPSYQSLIDQWNSLAQQQSDLVTANPSCF